MRRKAAHLSKRFKSLEDVKKYFEEAHADASLVDALLFLASEIEMLQIELWARKNACMGHKP
jgi:hypothetical protein